MSNGEAGGTGGVMMLPEIVRQAIEDRVGAAIEREMKEMGFEWWGGCGVMGTRTQAFKRGEGDNTQRLRVQFSLVEIEEDRMPLSEREEGCWKLECQGNEYTLSGEVESVSEREEAWI
jgi:hypothetical protein